MITDDWERGHIERLVAWLHSEIVYSHGGDGSGIWYSERFNVHDDILPIVREQAKRLEIDWAIGISDDKKTIHWNQEQEGLYITNDRVMFDTLLYQDIKLQW